MKDLATKAAGGAKIENYFKEEFLAETQDGKATKLEKNKDLCDAEITKPGQLGEIVVEADGTIVTGLAWEDTTKPAKPAAEKPAATDTAPAAADKPAEQPAK